MKDNNIAITLKALRKEKNITQKQLATETGLSLSSIVSYENGLREPNSKAMVTLEKFFGVSGEYLRGELTLEERETIREVHELSMINFEKMCDSLDEVTLGRIHSILISLRKLQENPVISARDKQSLFECICAIIGRIEIYADEIRYAPDNVKFDYERHNKRFISAEVETIKEIVNLIFHQK